MDNFASGASRRAVACAFVAALAAGASISGVAQHTALATDPSGSATAAQPLPDFAALVQRCADAVVNVDVTLASSASGSAEDSFPEFFRRFGIPPPELGPRGRPPIRGSGSGFIVTPDGHVLTNAHLVADAVGVTVRLADRREFRAKVIGTDAVTDIAVLDIDARDLPTAKIGSSAELRPGQWVVAIGSPFGLESTATAGIVSATSRAVGTNSYVPFIQTDIAVNPGNSGGPLFNLQGEVIGINSLILSRTGGYMGLSFAIPIDVAMDVRDQLIKTGRVVRGRIGVAVQDVDAELAQSFGLDRPRGALVNSVEEGGPAAVAGLKPGDVILSIDGRQVDRYGTLGAQIATMKPGGEARLTVWRDGDEHTMDVRIAEMVDRGKAGASPARNEVLGMTLRSSTTAARGRGAATEGLIVERAEGKAAKAGVRAGDIVLGVAGRQIESVEELRSAVQNAKGSVALLIQRGRAQIFVPVPIE